MDKGCAVPLVIFIYFVRFGTIGRNFRLHGAVGIPVPLIAVGVLCAVCGVFGFLLYVFGGVLGLRVCIRIQGDNKGLIAPALKMFRAIQILSEVLMDNLIGESFLVSVCESDDLTILIENKLN